jgi:hypothetical protein
MNEKEMKLAERVEKILGKDVKYTAMVHIIEELVEVIENGRVSNSK